MAQPYVGEIRMFAGYYAPAGWVFCNGALLSIAEYETLFQLIGTTYGGNGITTFAVPDLSGRVPIHYNATYPFATSGGTERVTLTANNLPTHTHTLSVSTSLGTEAAPGGNVLAQSHAVTPYVASPPTTAMSLSMTGFGQGGSHENMQPFVCLNYIISLFGIFPSP